MDRRSFLQTGIEASALAGLSLMGGMASAQAAPAAAAAKPVRILFLNKLPRRKEMAAADAAAQKLLESYTSPGTKIDVGYPDNFDGAEIASVMGAQKKLNGLDHLMETPALVKKIFWAEQNGYNAVISSDTFDPGVEGGRLAVSIPVIGLFRSSIHTALMLSDRIALTVPLPTHIPLAWRLLRNYGLESFVSAIVALDVYETDMLNQKKKIFDTTAKLIRSLVDEHGAQIIVPLGGALIPYVVNPDDLAKATGVQVFNTKAIGIRLAEACVTLGMTQSALAYPKAKLNSADFDKRL